MTAFSVGDRVRYEKVGNYRRPGNIAFNGLIGTISFVSRDTCGVLWDVLPKGYDTSFVLTHYKENLHLDNTELLGDDDEDCV